MQKFRHLVAVDQTGINQNGIQRLQAMSQQADFYCDLPDEQTVIDRLQGADCLLVSYKTPISGRAIRAAKDLKYIGMCCSLYGPDSANVDIRTAQELGIPVTGIFDYGDNGVIEYELSALIQLLHGFSGPLYKGRPRELGGLKVGIIGLGTVGILLADALRYFGCELYYYSRTRKPSQEERGLTYLPLHQLLKTCDAVSTHLPRGLHLLDSEAFSHFGGGKILLNTSLGPTFEIEALKNWLAADPDNYYLCDGCGMGTAADQLQGTRGVLYTPQGSGASIQCTQRLTDKVIANAQKFLDGAL